MQLALLPGMACLHVSRRTPANSDARHELIDSWRHHCIPKARNHTHVLATSDAADAADSGKGADRVPAASTSSSSPSLFSRFRATAQRQSELLRKWGLAGVVAYGACNTIYYSTAFCLCWLYVANVPKGQGLAAAGTAFLQVFATVWAGSQVTKLPRAALALFLAPFTDRFLDIAVERLPVKSKKEAFLWFLGACLALAACLFGTVVLAWQ